MEKQAPAIPRHRFPAAVYSSGVHWPHPIVCHPSISTKRTLKSSGIGAFEICDSFCQCFSCTISALIWGLCCIKRELIQLPLLICALQRRFFWFSALVDIHQFFPFTVSALVTHYSLLGPSQMCPLRTGFAAFLWFRWNPQITKWQFLCFLSMLTLQTHQDCYLWAVFLQINVSSWSQGVKSSLWWVRKAWRAKQLFVSCFLVSLELERVMFPACVEARGILQLTSCFLRACRYSGADVPLPHPRASPLLLPGALCWKRAEKAMNNVWGEHMEPTKTSRFLYKPVTQVFYYSPQWILPFLNKVSY